MTPPETSLSPWAAIKSARVIPCCRRSTDSRWKSGGTRRAIRSIGDRPAPWQTDIQTPTGDTADTSPRRPTPPRLGRHLPDTIDTFPVPSRRRLAVQFGRTVCPSEWRSRHSIGVPLQLCGAAVWQVTQQHRSADNNDIQPCSAVTEVTVSD